MFYNPYGSYPQTMTVIRVNGENGARSLRLAPNSSALVLDETAPLVWLCQTDGAGYMTVSPYKIEPFKVTTPESLEARIARLEAHYESYLGQIAKQQSCTKSSTEPDQSNVEHVQNRTESTGSA